MMSISFQNGTKLTDGSRRVDQCRRSADRQEPRMRAGKTNTSTLHLISVPEDVTMFPKELQSREPAPFTAAGSLDF